MKSDVQKAYDYVERIMLQRAKFELLAEECSELGQAALKYIRAAGWSDNPTPIPEYEAWEKLNEEAIDVFNALRLAGFDLDDLIVQSYNSPKWERCANRLDGIDEG